MRSQGNRCRGHITNLSALPRIASARWRAPLRKRGYHSKETKAVKRDPHRAQREAQAEFCDSVTAMGHRYLQIRDLGDVLELLK